GRKTSTGTDQAVSYVLTAKQHFSMQQAQRGRETARTRWSRSGQPGDRRFEVGAMSWRKWIVRGLVFSIAGACACAAYVYRYWTNPAAVRAHVTTLLKTHFPGTIISLEGAHL